MHDKLKWNFAPPHTGPDRIHYVKKSQNTDFINWPVLPWNSKIDMSIGMGMYFF